MTARPHSNMIVYLVLSQKKEDINLEYEISGFIQEGKVFYHSLRTVRLFIEYVVLLYSAFVSMWYAYHPGRLFENSLPPGLGF